MAARYAQIVVDVPVRRVDKYYDYLIPDRLEARVEPGSRVLVPFGARSVEGFVVSRSAQPAVENVREIIDCVTDAPGVPRELLQVSEWMADTYVCLLIEALRAMVPSGTRVESSVIVRLAGSEDDARRAKIDAAARRVFDYLAECGGSAARNEIAAALEVAAVSRHVATLTRAGLVEAVRGPGGGYKLARSAESIRISEILQAVEEARIFRAVGQFAGGHAIRLEARLGFGQRQVEVVEQPLPAPANRRGGRARRAVVRPDLA